MGQFSVGQEVVCVAVPDPIPNPWHRAYPIVKGRHYIVRGVEKGARIRTSSASWHVRIDSSPRLWKEENFRPVRFDPVNANMGIYLPVKGKEMAPVKGVRVYIMGKDDWEEIDYTWRPLFVDTDDAEREAARRFRIVGGGLE